MSEAPGLWLYAVAECDGAAGADAAGPGDLAGVAGTGVRLTPAAGDLAAVVSDVDLAEFGADALRRNMEDLDWLAAVARAHHSVIEAAAQWCTPLPMRLATVYASEDSLRAAIAARAAGLRQALDRLRYRAEWGVKGYVTAGGAGAGAGASAAAGAATAGAGIAYLRRRRDELSAQREAAHGAADSARAAHCELARHAVQSRLHPPQSPQLSGRAEAMVLNGSYLLEAARAAGFSAAVAELNDSDPRLRLELTGPWPPYSFTGEEP